MEAPSHASTPLSLAYQGMTWVYRRYIHPPHDIGAVGRNFVSLTLRLWACGSPKDLFSSMMGGLAHGALLASFRVVVEKGKIRDAEATRRAGFRV